MGNFVPGQPWFTHANWATNQIPVGASNVILGAAASSGSLFVASGDNNLVFSAANVFSVGGLTWATNYNIFPNSTFVPGITFNGTNFVAVGAIPGIASSGTNLPENKNWNTANLITPAPSFFESFRGITPFGARGFAACGVAGPTEEICNGDVAVLQSVLTGIGPWTVQWTGGTNNYTQVVNTNVAGPYTNALVIPNTAFNPTNVLLNQTTNYSYTITGVTSGTNADMCSGSVSGGPATVTVSPRPTAFVSGSTNIVVTNTVPVTNVIQANLTGFGPWTITWSDGVVQVTNGSPALHTVVTNLTSVTNYIYTFEYYAHGSPSSKNPYVTNTLQGATYQNSGSHSGQWQLNQTINGHNYYTISTNSIALTVPSQSFYFSVTNLSDAIGSNCGARTNDMQGTAVVALNASSSALVSLAPGATNSICLLDGTELQAALSGTPPWVITWSDGRVQTNGNGLDFYTVAPTNTFTYYITNLVDGFGNPSTNFSGSVTVTVIPLSTGVPVPHNQTNCAGLPNPTLSVTVASGDSADWYDSTRTNLLYQGTTNYVPSDTVAGVHKYFATEVNAGDCGTNQIEVDLVLVPCTNPPAIYLSGTNGTVRWFGNLTLQDTTNLAPPVVWQDLSNGIFGTNVLHFTNGVPPWTNSTYFFRLNTN